MSGLFIMIQYSPNAMSKGRVAAELRYGDSRHPSGGLRNGFRAYRRIAWAKLKALAEGASLESKMSWPGRSLSRTLIAELNESQIGFAHRNLGVNEIFAIR